MQNFLQSRGCLQEQFMILDLSQAPHDSNQDLIIASLQFSAQARPSLLPVRVNVCIDAQRNYLKLFGPSDAKNFINLVALPFADYHDAIRCQARQKSLS